MQLAVNCELFCLNLIILKCDTSVCDVYLFDSGAFKVFMLSDSIRTRAEKCLCQGACPQSESVVQWRRRRSVSISFCINFVAVGGA